MKNALIILIAIVTLGNTLDAAPNPYRLKRLTLNLPDQTKQLFYDLEYNSPGNIITMTESRGNTVITKILFDYKDTLFALKALNSNNTLRYHSDYALDPSGNILSIKKYNDADSLIEVTKYIYKGTKLDQVLVYNNKNKLIEKRHFIYDNNLLKKVKMTHPDGKIKNIVSFNYDNNGNKSSMTNVDHQNKLIFKAKYEYEKGKISYPSMSYLLY